MVLCSVTSCTSSGNSTASAGSSHSSFTSPGLFRAELSTSVSSWLMYVNGAISSSASACVRRWYSACMNMPTEPSRYDRGDCWCHSSPTQRSPTACAMK